jgi:diguanylate cyclase (GGDEF)-like protein
LRARRGRWRTGAVAAWHLGFAACIVPAFGSEQSPIEMSQLDIAPDGASGATTVVRAGVHWIRLQLASLPASGVPVVVVRSGRQTDVQLAAPQGVMLPRAATLAGFRGMRESIFALPENLRAGGPVYLRIESRLSEPDTASIRTSTLADVLAAGADRARVIALSVGALFTVSIAALLIWFVLKDKLFILYATLFSLQALYIVYLSGQGFEWPLLSVAAPLGSFAWNVPVGLSGAAACLFVREIADLRHASPRIDAIFGWFAVAFVLVTIANVAKLAGYGLIVNALGNLIFSVAAVFTVVIAFLAWRRGNRAAGWFLIAWSVLDGVAIATAVRFLFASNDANADPYYYALPLSMVAASVLVALGVADRLRQQRDALSDAERRAQIDSLTGVLNRRSLIERLDAACLRARARALPIAVLFIDLDHFKHINDTHGHQAGDACLRAVIEPIHSELRQSDVIGRFGGEEFVVVLSSADGAAALLTAERILERVANVAVAGYGEPVRLTCSIGVAASDMLAVWGEQLIARADEAVYAAKRSGRNRVQVAAAVGVPATKAVSEPVGSAPSG